MFSDKRTSGGAPGQRARAAARPPASAGGLLGVLLASLVLATGLSASVAWGQESLGEVVGSWGGVVNTVFIDEEADPWTAYVGSGRRLVILDVEDPANIVELGSIDLGNQVNDVKVRGGYAYVTTYFRPNAFSVIDVSDPAAPQMVWHLTSPVNFVGENVELRGNVVYVVSAVGWAKRVYAFDISDAENPVPHGRVLAYGSYPAQGFGLSGDLMYVAGMPAGSWEPYLWIFDLSADPYAPALVGSVQLAPRIDYALSLAVEGNYVCVTTDSADGLLVVVDVSNPEMPSVAGYYDQFDVVTNYPMVGALSDGLAYVADANLDVLDIATCPASPHVVSTFETHGAVSGVAVFGTRAYVMDEGEGLIILDLSTRTDPLRLGNWHSPAELRKMAKVGDLLYITDEWNGISILDVSNPRQPALVGVYQTGEDSGRWGDNWGIEVRDERAYLSAGTGGLEIADVSNPSQPAMLGAFRFEYGYRSRAVTLTGDVAHVGVQPLDFGLMVNLDISDPDSIVDVGFVGVGSPPLTIDVTAGLASIARWGLGGVLATADTADPTCPVVLADGWRGGVDLVRAGNLVYLANDDSSIGGLYVVDVGDPANPGDVGQFPAAGASAVALRGNTAYLVAWYEGERQVLTFDVGEPSTPVLLANAPVPGGQDAVLVDGRYVYVTGGEGANSGVGLAIIEMPAMPGDLNCDGAINGYDIDPFVLALTDPAGYAAAFSGCDLMAADCNGDGAVNGYDIDPFVALLVGK
jgi:hypothetical protein